ncbi:MAG: acetyl-CoA carboxylase biotin carboxyl carrier protein subunit [Afipia sp.]|jgi:hypothetical protein|nr:acetyl-CoA carboxylase biotin carboxyl carrier protein subunit [Afipia sp.]
MAEINLTTEVAGRVCAISTVEGANVTNGDDILFVEAMKMEIPVSTSAAGKIKSILVAIDDPVVEGQVVAILET